MITYGIVLLIIASAAAFGQTEQPKQQTIRRFFQLRERMLDQRGTERDVEELLKLFSADARYEHPAFNVSMDLAQARSGMKSHLKEGRDASIEIRKMLIGADFAVAETTLRYMVKSDAGDEKPIVRPGAAIFEFEGDRIKRVAEY